MSLASRLSDVRRTIAAAAERSGRDAGSVRLIAVSKTFSVHVLEEAVGAGVFDLGESRAQELRDKALALGPEVRWHFIGPLQTNKVRYVVGVAEMIHSLDRIGLAQAISGRAASRGKVQEVLIEVNLAGEEAKSGVEPARALALAEETDALDGVRVRGLMTMPPFTNDPEEARPYFKALRELSWDLVERLPGAGELSMGMTRDFEVAIEEGATMVRVGEGIFGPRPRRTR